MSSAAQSGPDDAHLADIGELENEIKQLHHAMDSRNIIGQAQGIIMARLDVDACHALAYLKRVSMTTNRKVVDIATEVAERREVPQLD